jgi:hypothetical protein
VVGNKQALYPGMRGLVEQHVVNWRNRSWFLTALVVVPDEGAEGVLFNLGGHGGGWSLYLKDGTPTFCYNLFGIDRTHLRGKVAVPPGEHQVRVEFAYDGGGLGKGGDITLYVDGNETGAGRVDATEGIGFGYESTEVGRDALSPVTDDYSPGDTAFTGEIKWIELEAGQDSHDHLIDPDSLLRVAMWKQ